MADIKSIISLISTIVKDEPTKEEVIYLGECSITGHKDFFEDGIFIDLLSFESFSLKFLKCNYNRLSKLSSEGKNHRFYLNIKKKKNLLENIEKKVITNLNINAEGGFNENKVYEYEWEYSVYDIETGLYIKLEDLDESVQKICKGIINHKNEVKKDNINKWVNDIKESKYAKDLVQLEGIKIKNENIHCAVCKSTKNIWLNLSDGYIGCGRKIFNYGGGCLNNEEGAALKHFYESGKKYPLVVKIGTITKDGEADVFSYADDENDSVIDPYIGVHLKNLGINIMNLEKTEITTLEKEIEENQNINFSSILDNNIQTICQQGKIGFVNLGNTCYMNSALQVLLSIKDISYRYLNNISDFLLSLDYKKKTHDDLFLQYSKLCYMIFEEDYITKKKQYVKKFKTQCKDRNVEINYDSDIDDENSVSINPSMFRNCINQKSNSFCNNNQQDIYEYLSYLINELIDNENNIFDRILKVNNNKRKLNEINNETNEKLNPNELLNSTSPSNNDSNVTKERSLFNYFTFEIEQRIESESNNQSISSFQNNILSLDIPLDSSLLNGDEEKLKNVNISLLDCLNNYIKKDNIDEYYCQKEKKKIHAQKYMKFKTFPPYLFIHLKRFYADENWSAKKINIEVKTDEQLNLGFMRVQPNSTDVLNGQKEQETSPGDSMLQKESKLLEDHKDVLDSLLDFEDTVELDDGANCEKEEVNSDNFVSISTVGVKNDSNYELVASIVHIGNTANSGHYICYIKDESTWYICNDNKIGLCEGNLGKDSAYIHLYKRLS
ncbi:hypothetical protein PFDG_04216 [Plasmodium falciparum Dd2]|uniref:Ubiquitin carboxyl-terminal hydrolase n=1 Tax=Plasmodium falciparum (isolate Dd2) TaxID=57267 RepID=A0A0L7M4F5_PLAF4|nr:hypothetical protein PFDG_04216 [Plasmodium falciparum Dd2]